MIVRCPDKLPDHILACFKFADAHIHRRGLTLAIVFQILQLKLDGSQSVPRLPYAQFVTFALPDA